MNDEQSPRSARPTWSITELAKDFDVTTRTIRHYEDVGLLAPERRGTSRTFHPRDRVRLELILRGKRLGFTLDEISSTINMYDAEPGEIGQLRHFINLVEGRRRELELRQRDIKQTLAELAKIEERSRAALRALDVQGDGQGDSRSAGAS